MEQKVIKLVFFNTTAYETKTPKEVLTRTWQENILLCTKPIVDWEFDLVKKLKKNWQTE